jgi:hypothetical protein
LVQKKKSRVADIQFTQKLFLHVADIHNWVVLQEKSLNLIIFTSIRTVQKYYFYSLHFLGLSKSERSCGQIKRCDCSADLHTAILNYPLVVTRFIETTELLRVQGPKNNI